MSFTTRYQSLNNEQKQAVDTIDGPLLVVAGPGTGKTELLSMRAANILQKTDTLPENILCLTFTDSGANAMRTRLADIIGSSAYRVAIQTFHSFGTEVMNQHREYFYQGAEFSPADDIAIHEILTSIFDELDYTNPLASKNNGKYVSLHDTLTAISELKQAGLTSDELLSIISANDAVLDAVEHDLTDIFANRISIGMLTLLAPIAKRVANLPIATPLPPAITPLQNELALSMARAFDEAVRINKTTPLTAWRNEWLELDVNHRYVFKDRKRHAKLRALAHVYFAYLNRMQQAGLYDYDDMILQVVHAMELYPDLMANLQEKYQYIMVDEFQDTNLAQLRMLFNLTTHPTGDEPNVMAVGDDDQAIYSFQGADINNIHRFRDHYPAHKSIVLTHNYRSVAPILKASREVIAQADGRLETVMGITKTLTPHATYAHVAVDCTHLPTRADECSWIAESIADAIKGGTKPHTIAVLARQHQELIDLVPYLHHHAIAMTYERRDNVLDLDCVQTLELLSHVAISLFNGEHDEADSYLPKLLAHPMYAFSAELIWKLSLVAQRNHLSWLEAMMITPDFAPLAQWLLERARAVPHETLETFIDALIGAPTSTPEASYRPPFFEHYFSTTVLRDTPDAYITMLEALRTLRTHLRDYKPDTPLHITDFLEFIDTCRELGNGITSIRSSSTSLDNAITLMTVHKAKGLEYDTVYIMNSVDNKWGERVHSHTPSITYPNNLIIRPNSDTYNERLRLYFVAMTRAKRQLHISYSTRDSTGKETLAASFLADTTIPQHTKQPHHTIDTLTALNKLAWHDSITRNPTDTMKQLLAPTLDTYKLSSTHLNNFIDITRGGPSTFLMNNLLRFPQAKSAHAGYGTAIHAALQRAHNHLAATGERRPIEDILGDFIHELEKQRLDESDFTIFSKRGADALTAFLRVYYQGFTRTQKTELTFANQQVTINDARLTGKLDLVDIKDRTIIVTDYKTGKPSTHWKGKNDTEKVKLHRYKQQLMFYQLLVEHSRDYARYTFDHAVLQFIEPDRQGTIHSLEETFTQDELSHFEVLLAAVWQRITTLDFPDISPFEVTYKGVLAFEEYLIDAYQQQVI